MIVPDVNVLVHAFRRETEDHETYAAWLTDAAGRPAGVGLIDTVLVGFVRVVTNPRFFADPAPTEVALSFVGALRAAPGGRELGPTAAAWERLAELADADSGIRGNLVPDAWIAAMALTNGASVATRDAGFRRFPDLTVVDPARD